MQAILREPPHCPTCECHEAFYRAEERQAAAARFVFTWLIVCEKYGRRTFMDFRVQKARRDYVAARERYQTKREDRNAQI